MTANSQPEYPSRKSWPHQITVKRTCSSVTEIINKYKRKIYCETRQELAKAKCRDCGHLIGRCSIDNMTTKQRFNCMSWEKIGAAVFVLTMSLLLGLALIFIRRYNHGFVYGTGGCKASILWTYIDCQILV